MKNGTAKGVRMLTLPCPANSSPVENVHRKPIYAGDPTSPAPQERLTDLAVDPREKPHPGAAAREPPRDSPVIAVQSYAGAVPVLALRAGKRHALDDGIRSADDPDALAHADFPGRIDDGRVTAGPAYDKVVRTPRAYVARVSSGRYLDDIAVACRPRGFRGKSIGAPRPHFKSRRGRGDAHEKQERGDCRLELLPKIPQSRLEVGEPAVELRLIELGKSSAHRGAWLHALGNQVTPPHYRLRGGILDLEPLRLLRKPLERLWLRRERRPGSPISC